jgi:autotransporter-associated beta strand protein
MTTTALPHRFVRASAILLAALPIALPAVERQWNGSGANDLITTPGNWTGGVAPVSGTDTMRFVGNVRTAPQLNGNFTSVGPASLAFSSSISSFTLGGTGTLTLNTNSAATANAVATNIAGASTVINVPIVIANSLAGAAQISNNSQASSITFNGSVNYGTTPVIISDANVASAVTFASLTGSSAFTVASTGTTTILDATGMSNTPTAIASFTHGTTVFGSNKGGGGISLGGGQASTVRLLDGVTFSRIVEIAPNVAGTPKTLAINTGNATFSNLVNNANANTSQLTLHAGDAASALSFDGVISGARPIEKTGDGTVNLRAANTFTGGLTISDGTLKLGTGSDRIADSVAITLGAATFDLNNLSDVVGTLKVNGAGTLSLGGGGTNSIAFADSSLIDWSGGSLSITGAFLSGSSIKFGSNASGLGAGQLAAISIDGFTGLGLDSSGFLTGSAIPEPSAFAALAGLGMLGFAAIRRRRR